MINNIPKVKKQISHAWDIIQATLDQVSNVSEIRPARAEDVFRYSKVEDGLRVDIEPFTFRVTQRAKATSAQLFISLQGWIQFSDQNVDHDLRSYGFKTYVGYFQEKSRTDLKTLLGLHYDWDERIVAHPIYHAQVFDAQEFAGHINAQWHKTYNCSSFFVAPLTNVRIPTAQMDIFCVIAQIFSDHLVNENTNEPEKGAYDKLMAACSFFECSAHTVPRCRDLFEKRSLRSPHWYPA